MAFRELPLPGPHIACLWVATGTPDGRRRRVLPDACVDVVWTGSSLVVAGPATRPAVVDIPAGAGTFGVRFRVGAAGTALGLPAAALIDASVGLGELWGDEGERIAEQVASEPGPQAALRALAQAIRQRLGPPPDRLVRAAARRVADPSARVVALGDELGIGERHLRRRFAAAVGYPPKTLQRILRFQRFLALAGSGPPGRAHPAHRQPVGLAGLAAAAGYADQAHLTRECSRLAGLPAGALLASGAGPAGERSVLFKTAREEHATIPA